MEVLRAEGISGIVPLRGLPAQGARRIDAVVPLTDALRRAAGPGAEERARSWAGSGAVRRGDEVLLVQPPGAPRPFEVHLWDDDWACSCEQAACVHALAAAIAVESGALAPATGEIRVRYRLSRHGRDLAVDRSGAETAPWREADHALNRLLAGWWGRPGLPRGLWREILSALAECPLTLDGAEVTAVGAPVAPRVLVEDADGGFVARLVRPPGIDEAFAGGVVRSGSRLALYAEPDLDAGLRQRLLHGLRFRPDEAARLASEFLPQVREILEVEVRSTRVPRAVVAPPRLHWEVSTQGHALRACAHVVYGDPPVARVERGQLVLLDPRATPVRDPVAERRLLEAPYPVGVPVERSGPDAVAWVGALPRPAKDAVLAAAPSFALLPGEIRPSLDVAAGGDHFQLHVDAGGADPRALADAWRQGEPLVPLLGGGWKRIDHAWIERHGAVLAELLDAADGGGRLPRSAAPIVVDAFEALELPPPAALGELRALAGHFDAVPVQPVPPSFAGTLRGYQQRGVDWIAWLQSVGMGGILADDMGLGKTVQCLAAIACRWAVDASARVLVVAPTSVLSNWAAEVARFLPGEPACGYHGSRRSLGPERIVLTSYSLLRLDLEALASIQWDTVVLDEAQAIKNPESQVAQCATRLRARHRLALTGTPVENRLEELWSAFRFASPGLLGSLPTFRERFAGPVSRGDTRARHALRRRVRPFVLRRLKQEVAPELPPRTTLVLRCELSERERSLYDGVSSLSRADAAKLIDGGKQLQLLEVLLRMRQACCHPALLPGGSGESSAKLDALVETLDEVLADGHKALVFSQWTSMLDLVEPVLAARGWEWARLDGSTVDRAGQVERFSQAEGPPIFLLSLKAGGTGLNLVAADYVFHLDPWWNPAVEDQATDRAHRIGQERPVVSLRLVAADTVEERILALQEAKREVARAALDDEALARGLNRDDLLALFEDA
jgi:superfamily II DNA or RNA helicase